MNIISKTIIPCLAVLGALLLYSCKKDEGMKGTIDIAKVNVINAIVGNAGKIKVHVFAKEISWSSIPDNSSLGGYNLAKQFIVPTGSPTLLKVVPVSDTNQLWYNNAASLKEGKRYTLYLSGTPDAVDTLFREEASFPKFILRNPGSSTPADSVTNIRFINLSATGPEIDINIVDNSANEASDLGYQEFTDFKAYPATNGIDYIIFEIRRSSDKEIIAMGWVDVSQWGNRFKSVVFTILGTYDETGQLPIPYEESYRAEAITY